MRTRHCFLTCIPSATVLGQCAPGQATAQTLRPTNGGGVVGLEEPQWRLLIDATTL